jgi:hypothetical protein
MPRRTFGQGTRHRGNDLLGPWRNPPCSEDHTCVLTSMVALAMRITFTDPGRPPRERFDTVPAVEITVPRRVCST